MIKKIINKIKHELRFNNMRYYTRIREKIVKTRYRNLLKRAVESLPPIMTNGKDSKLTLAILANKRNLYESLATLYSFCFWKNDVQLHYHEDGSLDDKDIEVIKKLFPGILVYKKSEETPKVMAMLNEKSFHASAQLRSHFLFSVRLFDMLVEKKTPYLLQVDSDVLFFDKPTLLLDIVATDSHNGCYNQDTGNSYTFTPQTIAKYLPVPMLDRVNAGLLLHNFDESFFAFVDNVIKHEPQSASSWHLEQTLFALYASHKGNFMALPKQYDLGKQEHKLGHKIISEHYCHNTGYDLHKDFIDRLLPLFTNKK